MKKFMPMLLAGLLLTPLAAHATSYSLGGHAYCEITGLFLPGITIQVTGAGFTGSATTDDNGYYQIALPGTGDYTATALLGADETVVFPPSGGYSFTTSSNDLLLIKNWVIASPLCQKPEGACWLTAGGARISQITGGLVGEVTRRYSFGGNVYPGCSPTAGQGGQWNLIDEAAKMHFQAFSCHVERCGNINDFPPGSSSPVTPFNFIEWTGTGRIQGIRGGKVSYDPAYCWARCEDRNEPGSSGQRDGTLKDRIFMRVFTNQADPIGSTVILIDGNGNSADVDPIQVTDGNLQLHVSSCDNALVSQAPGSARSGRVGTDGARTQTTNEFWFATSPNPAVEMARINFGLPRDGRVSFNVFDVSGRMVRQITDEMMSAGTHSVDWNLQDASGRRVSTGMYFVQMKSNGMTRTQRVAIN